jgi:hypothetical protein
MRRAAVAESPSSAEDSGFLSPKDGLIAGTIAAAGTNPLHVFGYLDTPAACPLQGRV